MNARHSNIKFTFDIESDQQLSFLDVLVTRKNNEFATSVFRKETFSGQGLSWFSFCSDRFKKNAFSTLICRGYKICSSQATFRLELDFLKNFFVKNGFSSNFIERKVKAFLDSTRRTTPTLDTCEKKKIYFSMPYFGEQSVEMVIRNSGELYPVFTLTYLFTSFKSTSRPSEVYFPTRIAFPMNLNLLSFTNTVVRLATHPISAPPPGS